MTNQLILTALFILVCHIGEASSDSFSFQSFWQDFDQAQVEFIDGSLVKAKQKFSTVVSKYGEKPGLPSKERRLIHYSLLRVAQLTESKVNQDRSIHAAIEFAPDLLPDRKIFPPPFYRKYIKLRNNSRHFIKSALKLPPKKTSHLQDSQLAKKTSLQYSHPRKNRWLWVGLTGLSLIAGYKIYQHNLPEKPREKLVVPTSEITRF